MADYTEEIAYLESLLNSAARDVSVDGLRTSVDQEQVRKRLAELRRLQSGDRSLVRPTVSGLDLRGCF